MKKYKFPILVVVLILLILAPPLLETISDIESESHFVFSAIALLAAIYAAHGKGKTLLLSFLLFGATFGVHFLTPLISGFFIEVVNVSLKALFFSWVTVILFQSISSSRYEIKERIWGSVAVYLLIGLAWSRLYMLTILFTPDSLLSSSGEPLQSIIETTYFSFSTLTTVGYGDIIPQTDFARALSSIEATIGMLFLAVWIAFLISSGGLDVSNNKK